MTWMWKNEKIIAGYSFSTMVKWNLLWRLTDRFKDNRLAIDWFVFLLLSVGEWRCYSLIKERWRDFDLYRRVDCHSIDMNEIWISSILTWINISLFFYLLTLKTSRHTRRFLMLLFFLFECQLTIDYSIRKIGLSNNGWLFTSLGISLSLDSLVLVCSNYHCNWDN